jgi:hypothetical protein
MHSVLYPVSFELHLLDIKVQSDRSHSTQKAFQIPVVNVHFAANTICCHFEVFPLSVLAIYSALE